VVLSEVGYYFDTVGLVALLDRIETAIGATGVLTVCHWRHPVPDYPLSGDDAHRMVGARRGLHRLAHHLEEDFVLDVFSADHRSVAARTGLV
jgi:hypothetical protein